MTKLISNKAFRRFMGIALSALLVVTLAPQVQLAYGDNTNEAALEQVDNQKGTGNEFDGNVNDAPGKNDHMIEGSDEQPDDIPAGDEGEKPTPADEGEDPATTDEPTEGDQPTTDEGNEPEITPTPEGTAPAGDTTNDNTPSLGNMVNKAVRSAAAAAPASVTDGNTTTYTNETKSFTIKTNTEHNYVFNGGTYTVTFENNASLKGRIAVINGATLNLEGSGTIDASNVAELKCTDHNTNEKAIGSVILVEGANADETKASKLNLSGNLVITGGSGTRVHTDAFVPSTDDRAEDNTLTDYFNAGGGILVQRSASLAGENSDAAIAKNKSKSPVLKITGAVTISGNEADAGGGIFIDRSCGFYMNGGTVSGNVAKLYEGGGIWTAGNHNGGNADSSVTSDAAILKATIIDNASNTHYAWGGGGIFIESKGKLYLSTVHITGNIASGLGGGISGCPHAKIGIGDVNADAAIYGNEASKSTRPQNAALYDMTPWDHQWGDKIAYDKDNAGFDAGKAKDFYCVRASVVYGQTNFKTDRKDSVVWYGRQAKWNQYRNKDGQWVYGEDVTIESGNFIAVEDASLGLTAVLPSASESISRNVEISGNTSSTHGGGIGCNGEITIGKLSKNETYGSFGIPFAKKLENSDGEDLTDTDLLVKDQFTFDLFNNAACTGDPVATAKNEADGSVELRVSGEGYLKQIAAGETKTFTFYLKERVPADTGSISYDNETRRLQVVLRHVESKNNTGSVKMTTHTPEVVSVKLFDSKHPNGETLTKGSHFNIDNIYNLQFVNTVELKETFSFGKVGFEATKQMQNHLGDVLSIGDRTFEFELSGVDGAADADGNVAADGSVEATSAADTGQIAFSNLAISAQMQPGEDWKTAGAKKTITLKLREVAPSEKGDITYDDAEHTIAFDVTATVQSTVNNAEGTKHTTITPYIVEGTLMFDDDPITEGAVVNTLNIKGEWAPTATKYFYGNLTDKTAFSFSLKQVAGPETDAAENAFNPASVDLAGLLAAEGDVVEGTTGTFDGTEAAVTFPTQEFTQPGIYWFLMTENGVGEAAPGDPTVYAFKVNVTVSQDGESLEVEEAGVYYAASSSAKVLTELNGEVDEYGNLQDPMAEFFNTEMDLSMYSYSVNAMSGEPVDQKCLVDPKIYKKLEGRSLRADEFHFKLIQVASYNDTTGTVISATGNDQYGMVDFDAANNQADEGEDPCCLVFTGAGDYYYRVIEDADYKRDPSVKYSDEVITFTAKIRWCDAAGNVVGDGMKRTADAVQLVCTDMFYGKLVNGENVRFEESADPNWHPTITNVARPMDLQVRKTSVLDRTEGLEGATYALYMVNDAEQGDIFLADAVSGADGWIYYENVPLSSGNLYYFKETAAPAGHTVSEFRSSYFYLEPADNDNGYVMRYTDSKPVSATAQAALKAAGADATAETAAAEDANANLATAPETDKDGNLVFTYENEGGVYDEATDVDFNKLDTRTHEWVEGAELSIVEKETGTVVTSWTSGKAPEKLQKVLNVGTTYILREDVAPDGYKKAGDVEFVIDQYGKVAIISGAENGNAELSDSTITLYDTAIDAEEVVTEERETTREVPGEGKRVTQKLAQTGDILPLGCLVAIVLISAMVGAFALRRNRARK